MIRQTSLWDIIDLPLKEKFIEYHKENPHIYKAFCQVTFETINMGHKNYGAKGIMEIVRWKRPESGNDGFKVQNNYTSFYARMFMEDYPQHEGFFRTKQSTAD